MVGNLGQPLDFVEYRIDNDEDGEQDAAPQVDEAGSDAAHSDVENAFESMVADVEAAETSGSGGGSSAAVSDGHGVRFEEAKHEVCSITPVNVNW